jgi:23S rRNA (guanosine2251-2'-O)-methyltransferase
MSEPAPSGELVWGRHAVLAVLESDRPVNKVFVLRSLEKDSLFAQVRRLAKLKGATVQLTERGKLDQLTGGAAHQGLVASVATHAYTDLDELIAKAKAHPQPLLVLLDGVEDPHNLGAIIRTAECAGAQGVILPQRRSASLTGVVEKTSAGALEHLPVARVGNLGRAIEAVKEAGFWVVGAEASGDRLLYDLDLTGAIALVIGGEGQGMHRLVKESCDFVARLPLLGQTTSLNASVAAGILLYEAVRQRHIKA